MARKRSHSIRQRREPSRVLQSDLVEGQPIDFTIDTGSPVSIVPSIFNPKELKETAKCFLDVKQKSNKV